MYPHSLQRRAVALLLGCMGGMAGLPHFGQVSGLDMMAHLDFIAQQAHFGRIILHT